jgi:flagellar biosynthesis protein FliQ
MTNQQLYLMIGIPMLFNAVLMGILVAYLNAKFNGLEKRLNDMKHIEER